ncbi:hypothetical protein ACFYS8_27530 [Kitasatospora sp. NPDC004615]|uniref:hypothetical protein n=1 Tax=unclassified Kitasatospora TaxID=2633591 RepID=UPI0036D12103
MLDRDRQFATPFLAAGEELLAAAPVSLAPGIPRPPEALLTPRQPGELEQKLAKPFTLLRRAYAVVNPVSAGVGAVEDRMMDAVPDSVWHGKGMAGDWHTTAGRLVVRLHEDGANGSALLVLTGRRLLLLADRAKLWQLTEQHALQFELPRDEIAGAQRNAKGVTQRGRLDVHFRDGSWVGVTTPLPSAADELAAAFAALGG